MSDAAVERRVTSEERFPSAAAFDSLGAEIGFDAFWTETSNWQSRAVRVLAFRFDAFDDETLSNAIAAIYGEATAERLCEIEGETAERLLAAIGSAVRRANSARGEIRLRICATALAFIALAFGAANEKCVLSAAAALGDAAPHFPRSLCEDALLRLLLTNLHANDREALRAATLDALPAIGDCFAAATWQGFLSAELAAAVQDPNEEVRLAAFRALFASLERFDDALLARRFGDALSKIGAERSNGVRILFAKNTAALLVRVPPPTAEALLDAFAASAEGKNRFLREAALGELGALICALSPSDRRFAAFERAFFALPRAIPALGAAARLPTLRANFRFAARVAALPGADRWQSLLRFVEESEQFENALGEAAKVALAEQFEAMAALGGERFADELLPLIDRGYLSGARGEAVRLSALRALPALVARLPSARRERYADFFCEATGGDTRKWRTRALVAKQSPKLVALFGDETLLTKLLPLYFGFCRDDVAAVRRAAAAAFPPFLAALDRIESAAAIARERFLAFGAHSHTAFRQTFVAMLGALWRANAARVDECLRAALLRLAADSALPVRIEVALLAAETRAALPSEFLAELVQSLSERADAEIADALFAATGDCRFAAKTYRALSL